MCANRLVHSGKQPSISSPGGEVLSFGTRSGTRNGVEAHVFRVPSSRDLASWTHALVQGVNSAVLHIREVSTGELSHFTPVLQVDSRFYLVAMHLIFS
jgi:hypothetical protein